MNLSCIEGSSLYLNKTDIFINILFPLEVKSAHSETMSPVRHRDRLQKWKVSGVAQANKMENQTTTDDYGNK